ncbi:MAG: outer membrane beta-barrel protein [Myxococcales bacterium]|nr:outer membrane beta-barrel protein [Myxococcales bacterium]
MKEALRTALACGASALLATSVARGQGAQPLKVGAGIGAYLATTFVVDGQLDVPSPEVGGTFLVPVDIADVLRLEPSLDWTHYAALESAAYHRMYGTRVRGGLGAFVLFELAPDARGYVGARGSVSYLSYHTAQAGALPVTVEVSDSEGSVSPGLGAEYFLTPHFSLGGELRFDFTFGRPSDVRYFSLAPIEPEPDTRRHALGVTTAFVVRTFFL